MYSSPFQAAGGSLTGNQSAYFPQEQSPYTSPFQQPQHNYQPPQTGYSSRSNLDELDILDQYSKPLLNRQGGELYIPPTHEAHLAVPLHPPVRYQSNPPPFNNRSMYVNRPSSKELKLQKSMEQQMKQQNQLLQQLVNTQQQQFQQQNNLQQAIQQQQLLQPFQQTNRTDTMEFNRRFGEMTREQSLMNEISNLRREIGQLQHDRVNPFQQQQQQMLMQQMLMNQFQNPLMLRPQPQPQQPQQQQPLEPPKREYDNRLEELVLSMLKERALQNAMRNDYRKPQKPQNYDQSQQRQPYDQSRGSSRNVTVPSRRDPDDYQAPPPRQQEPYDFSNYNKPPSRRQMTPQSTAPPKLTRNRMQRAKRLVKNFVLFLRWIRQEVKISRIKLRTYEMEEFRSDLSKSTSGAIGWYAETCVRGFKSIIQNSKQEQEITDATATKLSAKDQESRFNNYTSDCDALIDDIIANVQELSEPTLLFLAKKCYDHAYFCNDPAFLFEFERDRLDFDEFDGRLQGIDKYPDSPMFKMLSVVYMIIKVFIPLLIAPWQYDEVKENKELAFNQNYILLKKLATMCSIFYIGCFEHMRDTVLIPAGNGGALSKEGRAQTPFQWSVIQSTFVINNNSRITNLEKKNSTKNDMLTLLVTKDQMSLFFKKKQEWFIGFKAKFNDLSVVLRRSLASSRKAYLELRKEMLQEKAKELQHFIPPRLRNVKLL